MTRHLSVICALLLIAMVQYSGTAKGAASTAPGGLSQTELEALIETARTQGVDVIVVSPSGETEATDKSETPLIESLNESLSVGRERLGDLLVHVPNISSDIAAVLNPAAPSASATDLLIAMAVVVALLLAAIVPERLYGEWLKKRFRSVWPDGARDFSGKTIFLLLRFVARSLGFVVLGALVVAAASALLPDNERTEITVLTLVGAQLAVRIMIEFWRVWISPNLGEFRIPALADGEAAYLFKWLTGSALIIGVPVATCFWFEALGLDIRSHTLLLMASSLMIVVYHLALVSRTRDIVAGLIAGPEDTREQVPKARRLIAETWHTLLGLYLVIAGAASLVRLVLGTANPVGPSAGMLLVLAATLTLHSVFVVLIDWWFYKREGARNRRAATLEAQADFQTNLEQAGDAEMSEASSDADAGTEAAAQVSDDIETSRPRSLLRNIRSFEDLAKQAAECTLAAVAMGGIAIAWGGDLTSETGPFARMWDIGFIAIIGYVAFQSVKIVIGQRLEEEGGLEAPEIGGEGAGVGVSRIATLLPLFRNFILIAIALLTIMIILSQLGIDIAPLFAGAGVVGLAIGFGAQTLIRDIFSGAFFLMDDAFRKGEYIEIGEIQGTVERISVRSMQVRHYDGPLHTVPFGEIHHLTNYSRDWAMMKLKVRVPYDTDVDKVRRLIKKLGKELLLDEELGPMFLQPLKSQGVNSMEDSAMVLRFKFMTRPGDQFYLKRQIYNRIQELFRREDIKFAHRMVTVRLAEETDSRELSDEEKKAIAGAVAPTLEEQQAGAGSKAGDNR